MQVADGLPGQPLYIYDDQSEEQYYIVDNDGYDLPHSADPTSNTLTSHQHVGAAGHLPFSDNFDSDEGTIEE